MVLQSSRWSSSLPAWARCCWYLMTMITSTKLKTSWKPFSTLAAQRYDPRWQLGGREQQKQQQHTNPQLPTVYLSGNGARTFSGVRIFSARKKQKILFPFFFFYICISLNKNIEIFPPSLCDCNSQLLLTCSSLQKGIFPPFCFLYNFWKNSRSYDPSAAAAAHFPSSFLFLPNRSHRNNIAHTL